MEQQRSIQQFLNLAQKAFYLMGARAGFDIPSSCYYNLDNLDFTFEGWFYLESNPTVGYYTIFAKSDTNYRSYQFGIYRASSNWSLNFQYSTIGTNWTNSNSTAFTLSTSSWHFFTFSKIGTTLYYFMDGVSVGTFTIALSAYFLPNPTNVTLGYLNDSSVGTYRYLPFRLDEIRLTKGVGRYSSGFTPPTAEFEYTPQPLIITTNIPRFYNGFTYSDDGTTGASFELDEMVPTKFIFHGGDKTITGKITKNGQPFHCNVLLLTNTFEKLDEIANDPLTGVYTFINLNENIEFLICVVDLDSSPNYGIKTQKASQSPNIELNDQNIIDLSVYYGTGTIYGTVKDLEETPLERRVVLLNPLTYKKIRTTTSNPSTGEYEFNELDNTINYIVIAEDTTPRLYNDIIRVATA